jgi:hypothetical protein
MPFDLVAARVAVNVLWIIAVIIGLIGLVALFRGAVLGGILLIILAFAIGPGGWFILD